MVSDVAISFIVMAVGLVLSAAAFTLLIFTRNRIKSNINRLIYTVVIGFLILGLMVGAGLFPLWNAISPNSNAAIWKAVIVFIIVPPILILTAYVVWNNTGARVEYFAAEAVDLIGHSAYMSIVPTYIDHNNVRRVAPVMTEDWLGKRRDPAIFVSDKVTPYNFILKTGVDIDAGSIIELPVHPIYSIINLRQKTEVSVDAKRIARGMFKDMVAQFEDDKSEFDDMLYVPDQLFGVELKAALANFAHEIHTCHKCNTSFDRIKCPHCKEEIPPPPLVGVSAVRDVAQHTSKQLSKQILMNTRMEFEFDVRLKQKMHQLSTLFTKVRDSILKSSDSSLTTEIKTLEDEIEDIIGELEKAEPVYHGGRGQVYARGFGPDDDATQEVDLDE